MTKKDNENFKNSNICWICYNDSSDNDVKVRDNCWITRKLKSSAPTDFIINYKLNYKVPAFLTT